MTIKLPLNVARITFSDKVIMSIKFEVGLIYNSVEGTEMSKMGLEGDARKDPAVFISKHMEKRKVKTTSLSLMVTQTIVQTIPDADKMSDFSSWGVSDGPGVDVTAPSGSICL